MIREAFKNYFGFYLLIAILNFIIILIQQVSHGQAGVWEAIFRSLFWVYHLLDFTLPYVVEGFIDSWK